MDAIPLVPTLETPRLVLRPLTLDDAPDYFEFSSDPEVTRFLSQPPHAIVEDARARIARLLEPEAKGERKRWAVVLPAEQKMIGTCSLYVESMPHKRAEVSYILNRAYWNRGFITEALRAVIAHGFRDEGLNRIEALCFVGNDASERVMQKVGMRYEGILRQYLFIRGEYRDVKIYSILRGEWS